MKRVLIGHFTTESNAHTGKLCEWSDYVIHYGADIAPLMCVEDIFAAHEVETIPTIYADSGASGIVSKDAFARIEGAILAGADAHANALDGVFLFLHGASCIEGLDCISGEHHILRELRKRVGHDLPIAIVADPHGNLSQEYVDACTILRCYRNSPHTDRKETMQIAANMLVERMERPCAVKKAYRKLPLLLGGERCMSDEEPLRSINRMLDQIEQDTRVLSASYHVGFVRHDSPYAGAGVVVIPQTKQDEAYAAECADRIADFALAHRREFCLKGNVLEPSEAIDFALHDADIPTVVTDSGDNTTAGALGDGTTLLHMLMQRMKGVSRRVLVASVYDPQTCLMLKDHGIGRPVSIEVGIGHNELDRPIHIEGVLLNHGIVTSIWTEKDIRGSCAVVSVNGTNLVVVISDTSVSFTNRAQFAAAGLDMDAYDVIVVKQGYAFPQLKEWANCIVLALTEGATDQRIETLPFQLIARPMYPMDEI